MKHQKHARIALLTMTSLVFTACSSTLIHVDGTPGADFHGTYLSRGRTIEISGEVPMKLSVAAGSLRFLEFHKVKKDDTLTVSVAQGGPPFLSATVPAGTSGVRFENDGGWQMMMLRPSAPGSASTASATAAGL